jgi:hypothetical protein
MKRVWYFAIGICMLCLMTAGCDNKSNTSVVNIPATADTKSGKPSQADPDGPKIKFDHTLYDFGVVMQGEKLTHTFTFTNTGKSPLVISSTSASCGCTTSTPPRAPIKPGEKGKINVTFDSKTKMGEVTNKVRVASNAYPSPAVLTIKATVRKP